MTILRPHWIPPDQMVEVIGSRSSGERFIGGFADPDKKEIVLLTGSYRLILVPFSFFTSLDDGVEPDFRRFLIADVGRTVMLGRYEVSSNAILDWSRSNF